MICTICKNKQTNKNIGTVQKPESIGIFSSSVVAVCFTCLQQAHQSSSNNWRGIEKAATPQWSIFAISNQFWKVE